MKNPNLDKYAAFEKIVGRDSFLSVVWHRSQLIVVDLLSMASIFAIIMTVILYKSFRVFVYMVDQKVAASVLITFIGMILTVFAAFIFAYTYLCARKYTPPIVEALATRISGGHDIDVPAENGNGKAPLVIPAPSQTIPCAPPPGVFTDPPKA